jgi:hypothetical protein
MPVSASGLTGINGRATTADARKPAFYAGRCRITVRRNCMLLSGGVLGAAID